MGLTKSQQEYVIETAVELLRHPRRKRLLQILRSKLRDQDYPGHAEQRDLDRIAEAIARTVSRHLEPEDQ